MSRYEHGRILAVNEKQLGSELVAAHTAGVMSLTVEDPVDFDEDGGHLMIADQVIEYSTYDDDTGEITLLSALAADATNSESVWLYDALFQTVTTELLAEVELDGDDDNTDALECVIAHHLVDMVPEGIRGLRGESVLLEQDGDEWRIVDVLGLAASGASGARWEADDVYVLTAGDVTAGTATCPLSHRPIDESVDARWRTTPQEPTEYTVNYDARTVTWPLAGFEKAGDRLWFHYTYRAGIDRATTVHVGYESTGWKYLQVASTDSTDRSAPGFNDSGWAIGAAAFGTPNGGTTWDNSSAKAFGWPPSNTPWATSTALWLRRTVGPIDGTEVFVQVRVDNQADIYWNGTFVANSGELTESVLVEIPRALLDDVNVLAVRANDLGTVSYLDCRVESR